MLVYSFRGLVHDLHSGKQTDSAETVAENFISYSVSRRERENWQEREDERYRRCQSWFLSLCTMCVQNEDEGRLCWCVCVLGWVAGNILEYCVCV